MVYTDNFLRVSSAQAVTATAVSTNSIDLGLIEREMGTGQKMRFQIAVVASATAAGAATVGFQTIIADDGALTANILVIGATDAYGKDDLVAAGATGVPPGTLVILELNPHFHDVIGPFSDASRKFLGVRYVVTTGPLTAGSFTTDFVMNHEGGRKNYPSGFLVS